MDFSSDFGLGSTDVGGLGDYEPINFDIRGHEALANAGLGHDPRPPPKEPPPSNEFLFAVKPGIPPSVISPVGNTETGYGPAPFLVPQTGASTNPDIEVEGPKPVDMTSCGNYQDAFGTGHQFKEDAVESNAIEHQFRMDDAWGQANEYTTEGVLTTVNVIQDFPWSHSPKTSMAGENDDVPGIHLLEHRLLQNPSLNSMLYNLFSLTDLDNQLAEAALEGADDLSDKAVDAGKSGLQWLSDGRMSEIGQNLLGVVGDKVKLGLKAVKEGTKNIPSLKYGSSFTKPYHRLYATAPTGFKYKMPYFTDAYKSVAPGFSDESGGTNLPFTKFLKSATGMAGTVVNSLNMSTTGTYIEQPKYPNFPGEGKSYTFSFPLLNTVSSEATQKNWELVFMLLYQNHPNRTNRSAIMPAHLYEALIPGVWYSRYAYMSRIDVTMAGTRRKMQVRLHPSFEELDEGFTKSKEGAGIDTGETHGQNIYVDTIIPDAYNISITVTELVPESQNYMMESLRLNNIVEAHDPEIDGDTRAGQATNFNGDLGKITAKSIPGTNIKVNE